MNRWRVTLALLLTLLIGIPLLVPLGNLLLQPQAWQAWTERDRVLSLLQNTALLIGGTLLLTLPVGITLAALLYRTNLPGRASFRFLIVLTLFIPLPLFASAWQAVLGTGGLLPFSLWNSVRQAEISSGGMVWTPWGQGMGSAIWIHSLAALPWVVLLVGLGLRAVEPELEEDALTVTNSSRVLTRVSLRRASAALAIAAVWIALQVSTEITVTDLMQIRTYAEEVYTQMVAPDPSRGGASGETRALAVTLPVSCLFVVALLLVGTAGVARLTQGLSQSRLSPIFSLGRARWFWFAFLVLTTTFYLGLPLLALIWRAGARVGNSNWSAQVLILHLQRAIVGEGRLVVTSLITAAITGMLAVSLALLACWCARRCRWFLVSLLLLSAAAWSWPGTGGRLGPQGGAQVPDRSLRFSLFGRFTLAWPFPGSHYLGRDHPLLSVRGGDALACISADAERFVGSRPTRWGQTEPGIVGNCGASACGAFGADHAGRGRVITGRTGGQQAGEYAGLALLCGGTFFSDALWCHQ